MNPHIPPAHPLQAPVRHLLAVTAAAWGLGTEHRSPPPRPPRLGFAISY